MVKRKHALSPLRAVAYIRCSTDEQALSPKAQADAILHWCKIQGMELIESFIDQGVSGGSEVADRPGLLACIDAMTRLDAGILAVVRRDRLTRDVIVGATIERLVERQGGRVRSTDGVGEGQGPEAALLRTMVDAFSQYERALIVARTRSALAVKKGRGERVGGIPWGYSLGSDGVQLIRCESDWRMIKRIAAMRRRGQSLRRIAANLTKARAKTKMGSTKWFVESVRLALQAVPEKCATSTAAKKRTASSGYP